MEVFGADFEDVFEVDADVGEFALEEDYDVFVVFAFLLAGRPGLLGFGEGLEGGDLLIQGREVLFDDEGEFVNFDGSVVEEGFSFRDWEIIVSRCWDIKR